MQLIVFSLQSFWYIYIVLEWVDLIFLQVESSLLETYQNLILPLPSIPEMTQSLTGGKHTMQKVWYFMLLTKVVVHEFFAGCRDSLVKGSLH